MNIKRNIVFSLESRKKNGQPIVKNVPIRMRIMYNGKRVELTTGYRIDVSKWDSDKQRAKNGTTNKLKQSASEINAYLADYYTTIQTIFKEYEILEKIPTPDQIKQAFSSKVKNDSEELKDKISFFDIFDEFVKESGTQNNWSTSTYAKFKTVKQHLLAFDIHLTFESLDESRLDDYVKFLWNKKKMRNTTIVKQIKFLKWFLRWTSRKGYNQNNAYEYFAPKPKIVEKKVIFLKWNELMQLKDFQIPESKAYLERVRDVFLFCCFTSLRYSDVYNLKRSDVKDSHIEVTTIKTHDNLTIQFNNYSQEILEKYKDVHFENDKVLPVISNQKMNDYLKELGKLTGIDEPIRETYYKANRRIDEVKPKYELLGTHTARRSFICNGLALGIPVEVIMKWTGHSDYKSMKPYIAIAEELKISEMNKFNI